MSMDFETYARTAHRDYAALADTISSILRAAIATYPHPLRLQQVQFRAKAPDSLGKKLEDRGIADTKSLEQDIKDLAGCRLIFYTNSDVARFLQSGIIQDNFEVDWDRTKIHHPVPGETGADNLFISNNYVVKLKADRTGLAEYARFEGLWCEVQVQTTLNHAWSETSHDIIYKKPALKGFGGKLFAAIEQRLQKIMKDHLLPAGYEFQKVLDDYERLQNGKELFDRGALRALGECTANNARYELLERFRDYVLPNYDDPQGVYPDIKEQLVAAVKAARETPTRPIETPFGNLPGMTAERIVEIVAEILTRLRYANIELTLDAVCELFPEANSEQERKHLIGVAHSLARNDLDVWKEAGPYVQTVLVQKIGKMAPGDTGPIRPILFEVLGDALKTELQGTSSTYNSVTLHRGSAVASTALTRMRTEAMAILMRLYETASSDTEKRQARATLLEATHTPTGAGYSPQLLAEILDNSATIVNFLAERAPTDSYELLQSAEERLLWMHRRNQGISGAFAADEAVGKARNALDTAILKYRDIVNANKGYTTYKILVGFESVFPPAWDNPDFDFHEEEAYREQRIEELVADVTPGNAEEWLTILQRCAQTESDDLATFPSFGKFLKNLSRAKPEIMLGFLDRLGDRLTGFLGIILTGLAESDRRQDMDAKIAVWLEEEKYLGEMAHYVQFSPSFEPDLLRKILPLAIKRKADHVVMQVLSSAARRYKEAPDGLIDTIFLPAIAYFKEKRDGRWINLVWYIKRDQSFLPDLTGEQVDFVLSSLVYLPVIETNAEFVLRILARNHPEKVFDLLPERLRFAASRDESEERYEAVPHRFYDLQKSFAAIAEYATRKVRDLFKSGDDMFQYEGGRLLAASFPEFGAAFRGVLGSYIESGNREDIEFVVQAMLSYHGEVSLNETCKLVVRALPADDALLSSVEIALQNTGVVSGEFGMVQAYQAKKAEMASWLTDPDAKIRAFAESYVLQLDRQIAAEQRRSEESLERRKRMYDDPDNDEKA
jgi:ppGpp synthetase/RelA/SpoT-type nucleotidyltranferase